ncbi:MAG: GAF domain-containing protein [Rhodobacteraceae bacterium]|nr:GAF domain-containing protein [Paracoccaceae bacterium]
MSALTLDQIRDCLESFTPGMLATCDENGVPNVSLLSQAHYVDPDHLALSYQFFNKTRANVLATRTAALMLNDPVSVAKYRLEIDYRETLESGPLFEVMKAKLAGIASHTGMDGVFRLLGADIYRVRAITAIPGPVLESRPAPRSLLSATRRTFSEIGRIGDLSQLLDATLDSLARNFGIRHGMLLLYDSDDAKLITVATRGYAASGIGSEVSLGQGVIGVAAQERVPIRIAHVTADYSYSLSIRACAASDWAAATEIPFPGLKAPGSQLALPILAGDRLIGVLFVESPEPLQFWFDDEDALALVAERLGGLIADCQRSDGPAAVTRSEPRPCETAAPVVLRYYPADSSVFIGHDYLIKGVAGAILWRIAGEMLRTGRTEFTNRELRLDPALRLPDHAENLEARLILLQRRLCERDWPLGIERTGRGRFRLVVASELALEEVGPD